MYAVYGGAFAAAEKFGDGLVCKQHELFNHPVGVMALVPPGIRWAAFIVKYELSFLGVQVQRPPPQALLGEAAGQRQCLIQHLANVFAYFVPRPFVQIYAGILHLVVGQAAAALNHAFRKAGLYYFQVRRNGHPGRHRQAVNAFF
jgi:hypothetical protein